MDDSISRKAAINALWKALYDYEDKTEKQFQESDELDFYEWVQHRIFVQSMNDIDRQTILNLPAIQLEHRWILCSERLPEPTPEYEILCCDTRGSCLVAIPFADEGSDTGYSAESDGCYMYNCIAWMPVPKQYKKG